jgi:hypothetical protein
MAAANRAFWTDPELSKYNPLSRIIAFDQFSKGFRGYTALIGNYEHTLDNVLPGFRDMSQPMLSNGTHWDTGSHGAHDGTYALKIATRPRPRSVNMALKRFTFRQACPIQIETYFALKPEATDLTLSARDAGAFSLILDLHDNERRVMPHIRYLNALDGERVEKWQFKRAVEAPHDVGGKASLGETRSHHHFGPDGWEDIPGGHQQIWHYLKLGFDLRDMRFTALQCNDRSFDVSAIEPMVMPPWPNLNCLFNVCWTVEADTHKRTFLYLDSVLVSGEWEDA